MSREHTNALIGESSPYLLQHAHNPVDWNPWGPKAFELARRTGKPIFLSIGYSTCYWCHVMERQCFENPAIAALMNEHFVSIKVDREERPDVDDIYMTAVQATTGRGGWPMSVFLTPPGAAGPSDPGLQPFYTGTYFPPEPGHGMPSFPQVLTALAQAWTDRRKQVLAESDRITQAVRAHLGRTPNRGRVNMAPVQEVAPQLLHSYDPEHGGFGSAPKFPQPCNLLFLQAVGRLNPDPDLRQALLHTLDRMARGGMYDQIAGGFHRYSTDEKWLVPHFEKMLYDNAQLIEVYLTASSLAALDRTFHRRIVRQTCAYVLREMTDSTGAFWSAQDAEVSGREGANYLWTPEQVAAAFGPDEKELTSTAMSLYGLDQGPNFRDPHDAAAAPANVLYLPQPLDQFAKAQSLSVDQAIDLKARIDQRLLAVRTQRVQPATDDKTIAAWNGMMIAALARAGAALDEPRYLDAARRAARALLEKMRRPDGGLYRIMRAGRAHIPAFLEDYAFVIHGLIELHHSDATGAWLAEAEALATIAHRDFAAGSATSGGGGDGESGDGGGYFDTPADQTDLIVRSRSLQDGAVPSGTSQMLHNLLDLFQITGRRDDLDRAVAGLESTAEELERLGASAAHLAHAWLRALEIAPQRFAPEVGEVEKPVAVEMRGESPGAIDLSTGNAQAHVFIRVAPGFHVSAPETGNGARDADASADAQPLGMTLEGTPGVELTVGYPPPVERRYPLADRTLRVYEGLVEIPIAFRTRKGQAQAATDSPRLVVTWQACTQDHCLRPTSVQLPLCFSGSGTK